ncbi:outer membrane lipoprotein-sorting protein [Thiobacillus sedimenti]|uniref:Outer membrane lipoprotein-sorting protein n=1 Tax=Thiobacillus sedimenti TaxID=3110231 RepID=A0ABZ1CKG6_9PROT|nr:outer membrane lipoprotein-sorting protein [Thiobacillus sp. SCUT-2]WRS39503.1 outer membrane lipoprotein-sorting protein [Thiobacillus sp. SCUT-2]
MFFPRSEPTAAMKTLLADRLRFSVSRLFRSRGRALWASALVSVLLVVLAVPARAEETGGGNALAREMLLRADRIRFPDQGFRVDVTITTTQPGSEPEVRAYRILSKGNTRTLVQTTAPAIDRDQILLMRDRDLWAFLPNLSQPIRLPLAQRLTGQVANGDLARANFSGDYEPTLLRRETIDGETYQVLQLDAVDKWVTYRRVIYWVNASSFRPFRAEYYALSGRLLKTARYQDFKSLGGAIRPTRLVIDDALRQGNRSILEYSNMVERDLPDKVFTKDYLKKLVP